MRNRIIISIFCTCVAMAAFAQSQTTDSLRKETSARFNDREKCDEKKDSVRISLGLSPVGYFRTAANFYSDTNHDVFFYPSMPFNRTVPLLFTYSSPTYPGMILNLENLSVLGSVETNYYPGLMTKTTGGLGVSAGNDKVNLYVGGIVNKYGFYGGLLRQQGITGRFTYRPSSPWSFTAFAYYF